MGRIIDIEYDGMREIEEWASAYDYPDEKGLEAWEAEAARRKALLVEEYGMEFDEYGRVGWAGGELVPVYPSLSALMNSGLIPELANVVRIETREIPPPQPGEMYKVSGGAIPYNQATLSQRITEVGCQHCRSDGFMGGYYYEVEDDDGTVSKCRGCWMGYFGDSERGELPYLDDDFGRVLKWNEQGHPADWKGCPGFDWD